MSELHEVDERRIIAEANQAVEELCGQTPQTLLEAARAWRDSQVKPSIEVTGRAPQKLCTLGPVRPIFVARLKDGRVAARYSKEISVIDGNHETFISLPNHANVRIMDDCYLVTTGMFTGDTPIQVHDYDDQRMPRTMVGFPAAKGVRFLDFVSPSGLFGGDCGIVESCIGVVRLNEARTGWESGITSVDWTTDSHLLKVQALRDDGVVFLENGWLSLWPFDGSTRHLIAKMPKGVDGCVVCDLEGFTYLRKRNDRYEVWFQRWPTPEELFVEPKWLKPNLVPDARRHGGLRRNDYSAKSIVLGMNIVEAYWFNAIAAVVSASSVALGLYWGRWALAFLFVVIALLNVFFALNSNHIAREKMWKENEHRRQWKVPTVMKEEHSSLANVGDDELTRLYVKHELAELRERFAGDASVLATDANGFSEREQKLSKLIRELEAFIATGGAGEDMTVYTEAKAKHEAELADIRMIRTRFVDARGVVDGYITGCIGAFDRQLTGIELLRRSAEETSTTRELLERAERRLFEQQQAVQMAFLGLGTRLAELRENVRGAISGDETARGQLIDFDVRLQLTRLPPMRVGEPPEFVRSRVDIVDAEMTEEAADVEQEETEQSRI